MKMSNQVDCRFNIFGKKYAFENLGKKKSRGLSCSRHQTTKFTNSESPTLTTKFLF